MKKIHHKVHRDIRSSPGLFIAVTVVIFLGVALFGASFLAYRNLKTSYDYTYETLHMADFTVKVVQAPPEVVGELESIPGVEAVTGRINTEVPLTIPGEDITRIEARVISLPSESRAAVNDVKVEEGSYFPEGESEVILMEHSFAEHHELGPGDTVYLSADDTKTGFRVAAIVTSPEYIWPAKSRQELLSSPETFGVVFVPSETAVVLLGNDIVNEFCFLTNDEADRDAVVSEVENILEPYTITDIVPLEDQPSNAGLKMDLQEFGEMAEVFPLLFLIVGALATYILLTRIVYNQRPQIGLMRALGYSRRQILIHYLGFAFIIGEVGACAGIAAGFGLSRLVTSLYVSMLGLPYTSTHMGWIEWLFIEEGMAAGLIPPMIAGAIPAYFASRLSPSEAMRTPPPSAGRRLLLERVFPFLARLSFLWKIPLRNIFRNRRRSFYTVTGVALGISLILVSASFIDAIDHFMNLQFNDIQKYDSQINFVQPQPATLPAEVQSWEGVERAEPVLQIPVWIEHGDESYSTLAVGLSPGSELYGLYSTSGDRLSVGKDGVLLSEGLQSTLDVGTGNMVTLRSPFGTRQFQVEEFVKQPVGSFGYLSLSQAQNLAGGMAVINGIMLSAEQEHLDAVREKAFTTLGATSVEMTSETYGQINEMMDFIRGMMWIMLGFGAALSLAIVFTTVTVSIMERRREIATMRTIGEGKGRITAMITIENLILGLVGVIPGIPLGYALSLLFFSIIQSDMMTFNPVIFPRTYAITVGLVILIMLLSQLPGIRTLNRLNLASVTKEQAT